MAKYKKTKSIGRFTYFDCRYTSRSIPNITEVYYNVTKYVHMFWQQTNSVIYI